MKTKEIYLANGHRFASYEDVLKYCKGKNLIIAYSDTLRNNGQKYNFIKLVAI